MSKHESEIADLLAQLFGGGADFPPVDIARVEYSPENKGAFIIYATNGDAFGGDGLQNFGDAEGQKAWLRQSVEDGTLAQEFSVYEPVPVDVLAERRSQFAGWEDIYVA